MLLVLLFFTMDINLLTAELKMEALLTNPKLMLRLPTQADILEFYDHLMSSGFKKNEAIHRLSGELVKTWTKADCPPLSARLVYDKMQILLKSVQEAKRKPRESQKKSNKTGIPSRRSLRKRGENEENENEGNASADAESAVLPSPGPSQPQEPMPRPSSRTRSIVSTETEWKEEFEVLFDILSQKKVDEGEQLFDEEFYIDQKGPRNLWISKNLNPDFKDQYEQLEKTEANRERRQRLASGKTNANFSQTAPQDDLSDEDDLGLDEPCEEDFEETDLNEFMDTSMAHAKNSKDLML